MIDIPADVQIRATIQPGSVFYYDEDTYTGNTPHYFVVLNVDPTATDDLVLLGATSQVEKARGWAQPYPGTLVLIAPGDYSDFTESQSAFNGNEARVVTVGALVTKLARGDLRLHSYMGADLVSRPARRCLGQPSRRSGGQEAYIHLRAAELPNPLHRTLLHQPPETRRK